jgi:DNA-binding NarL/FixJ family response regulator
LASKGLANKQIGRALGITERTVKVHLTNIYRRIGVTDRTSAALWPATTLGSRHRCKPCTLVGAEGE